MTETLAQRAQRFKHSDELLTLDTEIAQMRAIVEMHFESASQGMEDFESVLRTLRDTTDIDDPMKLARVEAQLRETMMPTLPIDVYRTLHAMVVSSFNMRYHRRNSIPIAELNAVMGQLGAAFSEICDRYNIPPAAKVEFANRLRGINISRPMDVALDRAEGKGRATAAAASTEGILVEPNYG